LAGLFFFRLYENQLIRQTEAELNAQCAVLAALFEREVGSTLAKSSTSGAPTRDERRFTPIEARLDLAGSKILGPRPDRRPAPPRAPAGAHAFRPFYTALRRSSSLSPACLARGAPSPRAPRGAASPRRGGGGGRSPSPPTPAACGAAPGAPARPRRSIRSPAA